MESITRITFLKRVVSVVMGMLIIGCTTDNNLKANPPGKQDNNQTTATESLQQGEAMKFSIKPPESWLWSHDIAPEYIDDVLMPGMHLARLSSYGTGKNHRFAAIVYRESGVEGHYLRDVPAAELDDKIAGMAARPISITTAEIDGQPRFSLALQKNPEPKTRVLTGLDEAGLSQLAKDQQRIADFTTYVDGGVRKYAAIAEDRPGPSIILTRVTAEELDAQLRKHNVTPLRIRGFSENGVRYFTAVAERLDVGKWAWYDDIDGDTVGSKLEKHNAYPFDLEAYRTDQGVRFTVVMYRDRN
ncbi:hypothetical protein [Nitrosomonas oligotropha]|uniref:hypothetical protein n=1 Tax=Nitrosomonas oligotropha TaxID=42354 RepID=UPI0013716F69|nr:hypothetical protein [Nitrosomonas oligotropha]MXS83800.1 hypothetical protein [Nitrosomonas oligotropha]